MTAALTLSDIHRLTGGRLGTFDTPCPVCSARRRLQNRKKRVLRIWRERPDFAGFCCQHCGIEGYARDDNAGHFDLAELDRLRTEAAARQQWHDAERRRTVRRLWSQRQPLAGTPAETYLREARGIDLAAWPATLGFLPPAGEYPPTLIAAYGLAHEVEPGVLAIAENAVVAIHLIRLVPDGRGKADVENPKITVGSPSGAPLVVAPLNDLLGLVIVEGIENALAVHAQTGLGAWASGGASNVPALADHVPAFADYVTVIADADDAGRRHALELVRRLSARGLFVEPRELRHASD